MVIVVYGESIFSERVYEAFDRSIHNVYNVRTVVANISVVVKGLCSIIVHLWHHCAPRTAENGVVPLLEQNYKYSAHYTSVLHHRDLS